MTRYRIDRTMVDAEAEGDGASQVGARRVWLDRLIAYYLETGRGMKLDRVADAIAAMEALSAFLDDVTGGGESVRSRLAAEGISSL